MMNVESLADCFREDSDSHDNMSIFATDEGQSDDQSIRTGKLADLLTILRGSLELLQQQPLDSKGQRRLAWAENAAEQLHNIILQRNLDLPDSQAIAENHAMLELSE